MNDEAAGLAEAWAISWQEAFQAHYEDAILNTHRSDCPYPEGEAIAYAVALANADVFNKALVFTGFNAEERLAFTRRRWEERREGKQWP